MSEMPVFARKDKVKIVGRGCRDFGRTGVVAEITNISGTLYYFVDFRGFLHARSGRFLAADLELAA
jgi:hypothetical protein